MADEGLSILWSVRGGSRKEPEMGLVLYDKPAHESKGEKYLTVCDHVIILTAAATNHVQKKAALKRTLWLLQFLILHLRSSILGSNFQSLEVVGTPMARTKKEKLRRL